MIETRDRDFFHASDRAGKFRAKSALPCTFEPWPNYTGLPWKE